MIKDNIKNANIYHNLSDFMKIGLDYLTNTDFSKIPDGRYEIYEDKVYANVQTYLTKDFGRFEAHRKYTDIQYIAKGEEKIGVSNVSNFAQEAPYDSKKDIVFFTGKKDFELKFVGLKENEFMILTPEDAHMPMVALNTPMRVRKVVVKVLSQA